ncbi:ABC transporter permease subunit [uncultured Amnibacterium sp.]|uniref:ABC transporter permease subunit n=1 Tax=uncultured Amnibacterium sp. TaxID=1631851 RepID=UPI0035CC4C80
MTAEVEAPRARPRRAALPVHVELVRQLGQWRVQVAVGVLLVLPLVVRIAFLLGGAEPSRTGGDLGALAQSSGGGFAAFVLLVSGGYLVTIVAAVLFGDLIAGEASRSTLKYLLAIPVPRLRLLGVKALAAALILVAGLAGMAAIALLVGVLSYGPGGMQVPNGPRLDLGQTVARLALATAVTPFGLLWAAALGLLLTVLTDSPLAAAGGVVVVAIVTSTLDQVAALKDFRLWLPTHYAFAYQQFLLQPIDLRPVADALVNGLLWVLVLGPVAAWWFHRKDISG